MERIGKQPPVRETLPAVVDLWEIENAAEREWEWLVDPSGDGRWV
jgi:hypothetical protein